MAETLCGIFLEALDRGPRPCLFLQPGRDGWREISSQQAQLDVESLALGLRELGVQPGDRVVLLSETRYEWTVTDLAILGLGAVTVPLYPSLTAEQCRALLADCGARVAVVSTESQFLKVRSVAERLPELRFVVHMEPVSAATRDDRSWRSLHEWGEDRRRAHPAAYRDSASQVKPGDLATIIYTSGTTGEPKGAMLSHGNVASNVAASLSVIGLDADDRCLSFLPLCHIFERMAGLYVMLAAGAQIAYARGIDTVAEDARVVRPTVLVGVPRFYEKVHARVLEATAAMPPLRRALVNWGLAQGRRRVQAQLEGRALSGGEAWQARLADRLVASKLRARLGGRLGFAVSGGAPLHPQVWEFFQALGIPIREGYGLTETSPVICLNPPGREKPGSVGPPIPGVEVRIDESGEILTRGPHVFQGYYNNENATREALRDGWFHTGDIGRLDEDGYLFITDRLKQLLVTAGGKKVAPQPLEARLKESEWVAEAMLVGDRRPYVAALLVPDFERLEGEARRRGWSFADRAELARLPEVRALFEAPVQAVNADLARFEQIKRFALCPSEWTQESGELTPTLKVKRRVVLERYAGLIDELYPEPATAAEPRMP